MVRECSPERKRITDDNLLEKREGKGNLALSGALRRCSKRKEINYLNLKFFDLNVSENKNLKSYTIPRFKQSFQVIQTNKT